MPWDRVKSKEFNQIVMTKGMFGRYCSKQTGGVDLVDQKVTLFDMDKKNHNWRRKVFKMLMVAPHNSFIISCNSKHPKVPFIKYLVNVAEALNNNGRSILPKVKKTKARAGNQTFHGL